MTKTAKLHTYEFNEVADFIATTINTVTPKKLLNIMWNTVNKTSCSGATRCPQKEYEHFVIVIYNE